MNGKLYVVTIVGSVWVDTTVAVMANRRRRQLGWLWTGSGVAAVLGVVGCAKGTCN